VQLESKKKLCFLFLYKMAIAEQGPLHTVLYSYLWGAMNFHVCHAHCVLNCDSFTYMVALENINALTKRVTGEFRKNSTR
jgi:hypothetical protein